MMRKLPVPLVTKYSVRREETDADLYESGGVTLARDGRKKRQYYNCTKPNGSISTAYLVMYLNC
jgi:hypothetical protein